MNIRPLKRVKTDHLIEQKPLVHEQKELSEIPAKNNMFNRLPNELLGHIGSFFHVVGNREKVKSVFAQVNHRFNVFFKPDLLFNCVACGDLKAVKAFLTRALQDGVSGKTMALSDLLLKKKVVRDYSDRLIIGTALQVAWGAQDPAMIKIIQEAMLTLPNGEEIIKAQYAKQFPVGWQEKEKKEWAPIIAAMKAVFAEIEVTQDNEVIYEDNQFTIHRPELQNALDRFRTLLTEKSKEPVTVGRHFNPNLLVAALKDYEDLDAWTRRGEFSTRNELAWCKIIGFIQRFLSPIDAYVAAQGAYYVLEEGEKLNRSFSFRYQDKLWIYPLQGSESDKILGENYAAASKFGNPGMCPGLPEEEESLHSLCFEAYFNQKEQLCRPDIIGPLSVSSRSTF